MFNIPTNTRIHQIYRLPQGSAYKKWKAKNLCDAFFIMINDETFVRALQTHTFWLFLLHILWVSVCILLFLCQKYKMKSVIMIFFYKSFFISTSTPFSVYILRSYISQSVGSPCILLHYYKTAQSSLHVHYITLKPLY